MERSIPNASNEQLLGATGRVDITPAPGTPQGGWGAQTHQRGEGADMPLLATCLVLSKGDTRVAIVDVDLIHLSPEVERKAAELASAMTGIAIGNIRISCTHTHSGPNTFRLPVITEGLEMVLSYIEALPHRIASAVWQATRNLKPVQMAAGEGACDININRRFEGPDGRRAVGRNPEGRVDRTVRVVRFDDLNQKPVAVLMHYACHPTIMAWENRLFTPDYPGVARRVVEEQLGGVCLFLQGAAGDIGPRLGFTGDPGIYRRLGRVLGLEASRVAMNLDPQPYASRFAGYQESGARIALYVDEPVKVEVPPLSVISKEIRLPVKPLPDPEGLEREAAALRERMNELRRSGAVQEIRDATAAATQAGMRAERARLLQGKTHLERRLCAIQIADVALISTQGEPFNETSRRVVAASPFRHTLFSGYSHGGVGYIPTREAHHEGGYEVETALFSEDAADILATEAIQLLQELGAGSCATA